MLRPRLRVSVERALTWQQQQLGAEGMIDGRLNTRSGLHGGDRLLSGLHKGLGYQNTARALASWSMMVGHPDFFERAIAIMKERRRSGPEMLPVPEHHLRPAGSRRHQIHQQPITTRETYR
jgi:hypothetical protein